MQPVDWVVVATTFAVTLLVGALFQRRGGSSLSEYFVSGRALPWWLAGTSMVATTFAADTPIAITGIVAREGVSGNWFWWGLAPGGLLTVFFFAALWHRAGVITDVELISLRYSGRPARFLRVFRGLYLGVLLNAFILGWVNIAMMKIVAATLDVDPWTALLGCLFVTVAYSGMSGLWGIVVTDFFQFLLGMAGTLVLAYFAVDAVGGLGALPEKLSLARHPALPDQAPFGDQPYGEHVPDLLAFLPGDAPWSVASSLLAVFLFVNWWATWYPGSEPGGGGYVAQRLFACKNERHAMLAGLWFNVAHYALRPWPWIVAGLCGIALYGNTLLWKGVPDPELPYIQLINDHLPPGWKGFLVAALAAAYMSTVSTQLNWGAAYLVNDVFPSSRDRSSTQRGNVWLARLATLVVMGISIVVTQAFETVRDAWDYVVAIGAGSGLVLILRWYWWRVNAWAEIAAMITAVAIPTVLTVWFPDLNASWKSTGTHVWVGVGLTTVTWVAVMYLTRPESLGTLLRFQERVRAPGPGWRRVTPHAPPVHFWPRFGAWLASLLVVYGVLFGVGQALVGTTPRAVVALSLAVGGAAALFASLKHPCFASEAVAPSPEAPSRR